jgi:predicted phosphodiesterase
MKKLIIIPDVHGRKFWIETVEKYRNNPEYHIVFLGDYLDPYVSYDNVSEEEAF